jgi:hypothetical protein
MASAEFVTAIDLISWADTAVKTALAANERQAEPAFVHQAFSMGSLISKTEPWPISPLPVIVPPCISTVHFAIDRPSPGNQIRGDRWSSGGPAEEDRIDGIFG